VAGGEVLYASWNGATNISSWRVLAGSSPSTLAPLTSATRTGFETAIALPHGAGAYAAVQALDAQGAVIGASAAVRLSKN
jgi:hypothetical protein